MRVGVMLGVFVLCASVAGCSRIQDAALPMPIKVNAAYPVSPEVRIAQERLHALLAGDAQGVAALDAQTDARMTLRATICSKDISISWFDSIASIKSRRLESQCFLERDRELQRFLGIRTIGVLLARPPLRPSKSVGLPAALPTGQLSRVAAGAIARDAGVAVLQDEKGDLIVVEILGAALIAQLPRVEHLGKTGTLLSPNGRVVAVHSAQQLLFYDAETGNLVWDVGNGGKVLTWLPEVLSFVVSFQGEVDLMLADGELGALQSHPAPKNSSFGAHTGGEPVRALIGTARELVLVEHMRSAEGIRVSSAKRYWITSGAGITSGNPVPMRSGRIVIYPSMGNIGWLDLDNGASGTWKISPYFRLPFAKLNETHVLLESVERDRTTKYWSFDIVAGMVSPVEPDPSRGAMIDLGDRIGFLRVGNTAWFGDSVIAGAASPLDKIVSTQELPLRVDLQPPRPTPLVVAAADNANDLLSLSTAPPPRELATAAEVIVVSGYEPKRGPTGITVQVNVDRPGSKVLLVLTCYDKVNWHVTATTGTTITGILASGYHPPTVTTTLATRGYASPLPHAYATDQPSFGALLSRLKESLKNSLHLRV